MVVRVIERGRGGMIWGRRRRGDKEEVNIMRIIGVNMVIGKQLV